MVEVEVVLKRASGVLVPYCYLEVFLGVELLWLQIQKDDAIFMFMLEKISSWMLSITDPCVALCLFPKISQTSVFISSVNNLETFLMRKSRYRVVLLRSVEAPVLFIMFCYYLVCTALILSFSALSLIQLLYVHILSQLVQETST